MIMKRIKKWLVAFLAAVACVTLSIGLAGCANGDTEKVTLKLAGQTANASGEYSAELTEKDSKQFTVVVGSLKDYELQANSSDASVVTASVTQSALSVQAIKAGSAKVTLSEKSGKANELILNVTVKAAPVVAPESLFMTNLTEDASEKTGSGTLADPYTVTLAGGKSSTHNLTVQPAAADSRFTWTVGTVEEETFTASEADVVTATQSGAVLTVTSAVLPEDKDSDVYYIKGEALTGDLVVYVKVTVEKYVALESIAVNGLTAAADPATDGYDYILRTAKGTNWNMDKVAGRLTSGMGKPAGERPANGNVSYYHNVNVFSLTASPAEATDKDWIIAEEGNANIFNANPDGTWNVTGAGETIVTITNSASEASVKIKLVVEDTVYTGILKSTFNGVTAATNLDWAFDDHADDTTVTAKALLGQWHFAMNKTTSKPDGDDGNQKIFWLGGADRPYGFDIETRLDTSTGAKTSDTLALAWTKAAIPAGADKLEAIFGSHGSDSYTLGRIVLVKEDGTSYAVSGDWDSFGGKNVSFDIPEECKGATVAVVIEVRLTKANNNGEFQCKGVWITVPVTGITLEETSAEVSQGSVYQIIYNTVPTKVVDDSVTYSVTTQVAGGEGKITADKNGKLTIATDAPVGVYTVTVTSVADNSVKATLTVTVTGYVQVTDFSGSYTDKSGSHNLSGAEISAKKGANALDLEFVFGPEGASVQTYTVTYKDNGGEAAATSNVVSIAEGKLNFVYAGTVEVTVTPDAEEAKSLAITFTVTVREGSVLNWGTANQNSKDAILGGEDPWTMTNGNSGVGEGADIQGKNSYIEKTIDVSDMDTLIVYARIFKGQQNGATVYMEVTVDGTVIKPVGFDGNAYLEEIAANDNAQAFYYDLSGITGEVTIRMTNQTGYHFVIQQITIS